MGTKQVLSLWLCNKIRVPIGSVLLNGPHLRYLRNKCSRTFHVESTGISWNTWSVIVSSRSLCQISYIYAIDLPCNVEVLHCVQACHKTYIQKRGPLGEQSKWLIPYLGYALHRLDSLRGHKCLWLDFLRHLSCQFWRGLRVWILN